MKITKQRATGDGTVATDCGLCVIAMLTDLLGFQVDQVDENAPPLGQRLFCAVAGNVGGRVIPHAIAVDEAGRIFDPANGAPEPGMFTLAQCVAHGTFKIHSCFTVCDRRSM
jgi:hypothetical protein